MSMPTAANAKSCAPTASLVLQDGKPQKVECTHCKSQHNFRTEPGPRAVGPARPTSSATPRAVDPEAAKSAKSASA